MSLELYNKAINAYYNLSEPIMSDEEFDGLQESLIKSGELKYEDIPTGADETGGRHTKIKHRLRLGSLHSYHTHGSIERHDIENADDICIINSKQCTSNFKYDGLSIAIGYEAGQLVSIATRGNGFVGQNITEKFRHLVPPAIKTVGAAYIELRGEIVIPVDVFGQKYAKDFANPRNFVSGVTNRSTSDKFAMDDIDIILYQVCGERYDGQISFSQNPIDVLNDYLPEDYKYMIDGSFVCHTTDTLPQTFEYFKNKRESFKYATDGVVTQFSDVSDMHGKNWKHSIAWKFDTPKTVTKVIGIEWSTRSNMSFNPIGLLEPVDLAGTTVKRVNLASFENLMRLGCWPGSTILIEKGGDIIPHVESVLDEVRFDSLQDVPREFLPDAELEVIGANIFNIDKADKAFVKFMRGIQKLGVDGLGYSKVYQLWEHGTYRSIWDLMTEADVISVDIFTKELRNNLTETCWDRNWEKIAPLLYERLTHIDPQHLLQVCEIDGVGANLAWEICQHKYKPGYESPKFHHKAFQACWFNESLWDKFESNKSMLRMVDFIEQPKTEIDELTEYPICLTGSPKPNWKTKGEFMEAINIVAKSHGFKMVETDIKKCSKLITNTPDSTTSKSKYAKANDIGIVTYEVWFNEFAN